jgi:hypothetical protein
MDQQNYIWQFHIQKTLGADLEFYFSSEDKAREVESFITVALVHFPLHPIETDDKLFMCSLEGLIQYDQEYEVLCSDYVSRLEIPKFLTRDQIKSILSLLSREAAEPQIRKFIIN